MRMRASYVGACGFALALLLAHAGSQGVAAAGAAAAPDETRLVVLIAVDQLRRDRLDEALPGGLGRIAREGRVYVDGVLDHALTETCAGHATMLSGRHPAGVQIPSNTLLDPESGRTEYCVADPDEAATVIGASPARGGRSPRNMSATTLGDWLKKQRSGSRSFAVSGKDRSAITLAGRWPDGVYWLSEKDPSGFTTSRYYRKELPDWVQEWNGRKPPEDGFWARLPDAWSYPIDPGTRPDDYPGESVRYSRTSPHPLRDPDLVRFADSMVSSPFLDQLTLEFAKALVEQEKLGQRGATDLLALSLSATDMVGHLYGPYSQESHDSLRRTDAALGLFLGFLEGYVGKDHLLVALTSDHGVLPLPEWLAQNGQNECPVAGGRIGLRRLGLGLAWDLHRRFTWWLVMPKSWLAFSGSMIAVNREVAAKQGVEVAAISAEVERYLESRPEIAEVWNPQEIATRSGEMAQLYRHSFVKGRSGDLLVQPASGCLISQYGAGTTHGTPYLYDRAVPIVFWGEGVSAARVEGAARTIDIAPTLARRIGIEPPRGLDGKPLF